MENIHLNNITEEHVRGNWEVKDRVQSKQDHSDPFGSVRFIEIGDGNYKSINGTQRDGKFTMLRESDVIYNPQLMFYSRNDRIGHAIITRLISEKEGEKRVYKLTLYFTTGLELTLQKSQSIK